MRQLTDEEKRIQQMLINSASNIYDDKAIEMLKKRGVQPKPPLGKIIKLD